MCPSRATKELHGPLGDTFFLDVKILARTRLCYILKLSNQGKRRFGRFGSFGKCKSLGVGRERIIIVVTAVLWVTPNAIFQNIVPHKAPTRFGKS